MTESKEMINTELTSSEALYGFIGWLTSLENKVQFSAYHDASIPVDLVVEFMTANNLPELRDNFTEHFKFPVYDSQGENPLHEAITNVLVQKNLYMEQIDG